MTLRSRTGKADFGAIYNQQNARPYYRTLGALGYEIPRWGADAFARLLGALPRDAAPGRPTVLDVCCSYGVGGVLLTTDLSLDDLYAYYAGEEETRDGASAAAADRRFFAGHRLPDPPRVVGLDVAENAVAYAVASGALDDAVAADLESGDPDPEVAEQLTDVDLVVTTGGVGYVTEATFRRLMESAAGTPSVAAFCLREYDYSPIADALSDYGLRTERADRTFHQRRFVDDDERAWAFEEITARGLDPDGKETDGHYHAELYVSRPEKDVARYPLDTLLPEVAGP